MKIWTHNAGQARVKDILDGEAYTPYPAAIAPTGGYSDSLDMGGSEEWSGGLNGTHYIIGRRAERNPLVIRQQAETRLLDTSPVYPLLAAQSATNVGLANWTEPLVIAAALPVAWMHDDTAPEQLARHIRRGLETVAKPRTIDFVIRSEVGAVVYAALLTRHGEIRPGMEHLTSAVVGVVDIGGSTMNYSILDGIEPVHGSMASPYLGAKVPIWHLMADKDVDLRTAETMLSVAATGAGDARVRAILAGYTESLISHLDSVFAGTNVTTILFGGGTLRWVRPALVRHYGTRAAFIPEPWADIDPGFVVAHGMDRYARMLARRDRLGASSFRLPPDSDTRLRLVG